MSEINTSNYEKFQTGNPLVQALFRRFYRRIRGKVAKISPASLLDAGCGEGETIERLHDLLPERVEGFDINEDCVTFTKKRHPAYQFSARSIFNTEYSDSSFDVVLCLEVLEHLEKPEDALRELLRVTRRDVILSVPHEPWFRLGNLLRGKYKESWGNHPEHIQQWNPRSFRRFLEAETRVISVDRSFPWIIAHCRKRGK